MDSLERTVARNGRLIEKINDEAQRDGRWLVVYTPEDCDAIKDILGRLKALEERGMA